MTKEDLIWVVIRGTGFLLVLRALLWIPEIVVTTGWLIYLGDAGSGVSEGMRMSSEIALRQLGSSALACIVYLALGVYLLRKGHWVLRLLGFVSVGSSNNTVERDARKRGARPSP